jgi:CheY-like chemotaxis protein
VSGLDLMRTIRQARPLKGVALSGYGTEADIHASEEAGFSAHLTKPIVFNDLLATIRQVSAGSAAAL